MTARPGIFRRLGRAIAGVFSRARPEASQRDEGPLVQRRWDAAKTNRLNEAHWQGATGRPLNADLNDFGRTIKSRSVLEASINPLVEGVINTHATDIAGEHGPVLQVHSSNKAYNEALEKLVCDWMDHPEITGKLRMVDLIKLWVRMLWTKGNIVATKVTDAKAEGPVKFRLKDYDPDRLHTPPGMTGDRDVVMGVRRDGNGRPTQYYLSRFESFGAYAFPTGQFDPFPADMVFHEFLFQEADQVQGVPLLASSLQRIADLADYDAEVLEAAKQAANTAVYWYSDHVDIEPVRINEVQPVERGTQSTGPPGWKPEMLSPTQPQTNYVEYRRECQADIGRPVSMPLMKIRLDASRHTYSSARFDGRAYEVAGVCSFQTWFGDRILNRCVLEIALEAERARALPKRPADLKLFWIWPAMPSVDPEKESLAERIDLENGTLAYSDALAARRQTLDQMIAKRKKDAEALAAANLPPVPTIVGPPMRSQPDVPQPAGAAHG